MKQFTDEELKQQYGIHLATRLQAGEGNKESKWADIDDDEDDWVPETVDWIDGTKSTALQTSESPADILGTARPASASVVTDGLLKAAPSTLPPSAPPPGKTILRPGARIAVAQTKPGLVLKSIPDKPVLLPKPSATSASKSPWAQLPPVEKVSPIAFNPPLPQQQTRPDSGYMHSESPLHERMPFPGPSPAREIAADDFDRSWQDNDQGQRELFNSQSGRYEPVKNVRRSSMRQEGGLRPPAVLQRPPYDTGTNKSQDARAWQRRRGSSNLNERPKSIEASNRSRESSLPADRKDHDSPLAMQDSHPNEPLRLQSESSSNAVYNVQSAQAPGSKPEPQNLHSEEDARVVQQRLMREKIEFNRKRKKEEEEREEAAKRERIRQKLAALESSQATPAVESKVVAQETRTKSGTDDPPLSETVVETQSQKENLPAAVTASIPETHPQADIKPASETHEDVQRPLDAAHPLTSLGQTPSKSRSDTDLAAQVTRQPARKAEGLPRQFPDAPRGPWTTSSLSPDPSSAWPGSQASVINNVWGSPSNDRTLGNGAFKADYQPLPSIQLPQQQTPPRQAPPPGPIGPPNASPRGSSDVFQSISAQPHNIDRGRHALPDDRHTYSMNSHAPGILSNTPLGPVGEPFVRNPPGDISAAKRAWSLLPGQLRQSEIDVREKAAREHAVRVAEEALTGERIDLQPVYKETFRRTVGGDTFGQRQVVGVTKTVHDASSAETAALLLDSPLMNQPPVAHTLLPPSINNPRPSRFFGPGADRPQATSKPAPVPYFHDPSDPPSPPPPDTYGHPAFDGSSKQPHVNLPRPHPTVKLPPAAIASSSAESAVSMPVRASPQWNGSQPIALSSAWQDRFRVLLHKSPPNSQSTGIVSPPPQSAAPGLDAASKAPLDVSAPQLTVSLPRTTITNKTMSVIEAGPTSKPTEEELMDEPREFGSSPIIRLPQALYGPRPVVSNTRNMGGITQILEIELKSAFFASTNRFSVQQLENGNEMRNGYNILIHIPGKSMTTKFLARRDVHEKSQDPRDQFKQGNRRKFPATRSSGQPQSAQLSRENSSGSKEHRSAKSSPLPEGEQGPQRAANSFSEHKTGWKQDAPRPKTQWAKPPRGRTSQSIFGGRS